MKIWLNGDMVDQHPAIPSSDRGFLLGDGAFDTLKLINGQPVFLDAHLDRLSETVKQLGFNLPIGKPDLANAVHALTNANRMTDHPLGSVRITVTRGSGPRGLVPPANPTPTLLVTCAPGTPPPTDTKVIMAKGRRNEFSPTANLKTLNYLDQVLAKQDAVSAGADDAVLLNTQGKVVCASAANLFVWDSNMLITPPLEDGCLPGIMRATVLACAERIGISTFEETLDPHTLVSASGAFLTNSLVGLQEITSIDGAYLPHHNRLPDLRAAVATAELESLRNDNGGT